MKLSPLLFAHALLWVACVGWPLPVLEPAPPPPRSVEPFAYRPVEPLTDDPLDELAQSVWYPPPGQTLTAEDIAVLSWNFCDADDPGNPTAGITGIAQGQWFNTSYTFAGWTDSPDWDRAYVWTVNVRISSSVDYYGTPLAFYQDTGFWTAEEDAWEMPCPVNWRWAMWAQGFPQVWTVGGDTHNMFAGSVDLQVAAKKLVYDPANVWDWLMGYGPRPERTWQTSWYWTENWPCKVGWQ